MSHRFDRDALGFMTRSQNGAGSWEKNKKVAKWTGKDSHSQQRLRTNPMSWRCHGIVSRSSHKEMPQMNGATLVMEDGCFLVFFSTHLVSLRVTHSGSGVLFPQTPWSHYIYGLR